MNQHIAERSHVLGEPEITTAETKSRRRTWSQREIVALHEAHRTAGVAGAVAAFPNDAGEDVIAKLESLGIDTRSEADRARLAEIIAGFEAADDAQRMRSDLLAYLRKPKAT